MLLIYDILSLLSFLGWGRFAPIPYSGCFRKVRLRLQPQSTQIEFLRQNRVLIGYNNL